MSSSVMLKRMSKYEKAMAALRKLDAKGEKLEGNGVIIGVRYGYISGLLYLTSSDANKAFRFKNKKQAQEFVATHCDFFVDVKYIEVE